MELVSNFFSFVKYLVLLLAPYCIILGSYRVLLHPLRSYPGPLIAKFSDAYTGFYALTMSLHLATIRDQKKYGPVMRHGPNKLVFNSTEALQDIYNNERVTKSRVYHHTVIAGKPGIFNITDKSKHRTRRKLIGQAINDKAMRSFEPTMVEQIEIMMDQLSVCAEASQPVNMTERLRWLGGDVVSLLAFGFPLNMQTDPLYRFIPAGLTNATYQNNCFMQFPLLRQLHIHHLLVVFAVRTRAKFRQMLRAAIGNRLSQDKHARNDLYSYVADHLGNMTDGIDASELWSEAFFFFPAGGDTTSTALSAIFFYLSRYPDVYAKLRHEVRSTFGTSSEVRSGPKLTRCQYLRACIDETLRMTPPVSGTLWREPYSDERDETFVVDGHVIPPGTRVGVCTYSIHHDERYFSEPFVFRPERWLSRDEETLRRMNSAFCPFSLGARGCAGKAMAYLELSLVVAKTLYQFDFSVAPGDIGMVGAGTAGRQDGRGRTDEFQLYDVFSATHDGPNLIFSPRENLS